MTCPYCGTQNEPGFQFCKTCGAKLPASAPQQPQYQAPRQPQYQAPQQPQYQAPQPQYQAPQQPQYQAPQQYQYQAPQQPQYQAPRQPQYQQAPQQPQFQAPVSVAPKQPQKDVFGDLIKKIKSFDYKALLKEPKKLIIPAAAVAAALVLIILISILGSVGNDAYATKASYYMLEVEAGSDEYALVLDGKIVLEGLEDAAMGPQSMDGSVATYSSDDELFVIRGKKTLSITDEYYTYAISEDGAYIAVIDYDYVLTVYNTKNGDSVEIAEDVDSFVMSPNGKTIAYCVDDGIEVTGHVYKGKESIELGEDLLPLSVDNSAKYIYCYDTDNYSLCVVDTKGNSTKIANDLHTNYDYIYLNKDHTQIIFRADGKWYASVKGGDKIKLTSDSDFDILIPTNGARCVRINDSIITFTMPVADMRNSFVHLDDDVSYLNKKWELEKVAKDVEYAQVSADGKTLVWLRDNDKLFKASVGKLDDPIELGSGVDAFMATADGSAVYFINDDDELMYAKGKKEAERIADDAEDLFVTDDGICLFLCDDSTLFLSKNGGKKVKITDELYDLGYTAGMVIIFTDYDDGEYNISVCTGGTKFKELLTY